MTTSKASEAAGANARLNGVGRLNQYVQDVLSGEITACEKVRMACQRHLDDMARSASDPDWPWRFDPEKAERIIDFMERFLTPTKGNYDRMTLMPWQCFVQGSIFGWIHKETGLRRYTEALIVIGRGNGKTTVVAGDASFLASKDGERGADVYLLANTKEQAGICFRECRSQIMGSRKLRHHFRPLRDVIYYDATNSTISHRASDSEKLDGLNPHGAIFDEIHGYRDFKLINVIRRGQNKRRQPLTIYITTMGTVLDGPLMYYYNLFTDAMSGALRADVADRMFAFICELDEHDDIEDSSLWIKANPSLGVLLDLHQLELDWARAKQTPEERGDFINKQLNIFTSAHNAAYVPVEVIKRNEAAVDMAELEGRECYGGFDLSAREDFTAAGLEFALDDGRLFWLCHAWVPQRKVDLDQEKIPYYEYAMQGWLTICPGEYITQDTVYQWFVDQARHYNIKAIGYDPANASWLVRKLTEEQGFDCRVVRQGSLTLNDPMKDLREVLLDGRLVHNRNALFRWFLGNVKLRQDYKDKEKENWVPTKRDRFRKIDGFAALLDAHTITMEDRPLDGSQSQELQISVYSIGG